MDAVLLDCLKDFLSVPVFPGPLQLLSSLSSSFADLSTPYCQALIPVRKAVYGLLISQCVPVFHISSQTLA